MNKNLLFFLTLVIISGITWWQWKNINAVSFIFKILDGKEDHIMVKPKQYNTRIIDEKRLDGWMTRANDSKYFDYGESGCSVGSTHATLKELFKAWVELTSSLNVSYALTHGSLLGAWRDGNLVPYDADLDVIVNHAEVPKLLKRVEKSFKVSDNKIHLSIHREYKIPIEERNRYLCNGNKVSAGYRDQCSTIEPLGRLIKGSVLHIDLVGYKVTNDLVYFQTEDKNKEFPLDMILPYSKCKLAGFDTFCPNNSYKLLKKIYNNKLEPSKKCKGGEWV